MFRVLHHTGDAVYLGDAVLGEITRVINSHLPNLILVSCGFDAAEGDDEGFKVTPSGYGRLFAAICAAAADSTRIVAVLEGGYVPAVVGKCVKEVALALAASFNS